MHGYRLSCLPSKAVDFAATDDDRIPAQASALSARMSSNAESGSLDHEVVLSRRLIQNCCPYLEDVLTLIKSLGRGWEQGFVAGGNGTPFRAGHSPRVIGASGTSPRSRRVIKPHPMKPMRVLPSLAEQHQRGESSGETLRTGRGGVQSESARLRLVEAFFHSLPDELQVTADFAVKRAVQNACEEVLAAVIRPAAAAIISRLDMPFGHEHTGKVRGTGGEGFVRHRVDHVMAVLGKSLMSKASSLAGERGHAVATAATLSLAPHSLSLRYYFGVRVKNVCRCFVRYKCVSTASLAPKTASPPDRLGTKLFISFFVSGIVTEILTNPSHSNDQTSGCVRWQRPLLGTMHSSQRRGS